jgi:4-hydroxybenzoate polyprenyltransferase
MRSVYNELVLGGHMLALGTSSIAASAAVMLGRQPTWALMLMAYLFSYGAYMMNRGRELEQDTLSNPARTSYLSGRGRYLPFISGACFAVGYAFAATVNAFFFVALLLPLALSLLYSVGSRRLVAVIGASRLKEKLMVKNLVISFSWALIPALVALYYLDAGLPVVSLGGFIFLRLMVNTLLFDVRDAEGDRSAGISTVPTVYGQERTFALMGLLDLAAAAYLALAVLLRLLPDYSLVMLALPLYSLWYRYMARARRFSLGFVCDFLADGEYVLWAPLIYAGRALL